jgi:hypothetical protein
VNSTGTLPFGSGMSPEALLAAARELASSPGAVPTLWPRAAALLVRQALEWALDDFWRRHAPGVERCSVRAQLLCLPFYLGDDGLAGSVAHAWSALSHACHHHPYDLAPTGEELAAWAESVEAFRAVSEDVEQAGAGG